MLSHYSFERKTKFWRQLFFHLLDLVEVDAQILHNKSSKKNTSLEILYEKAYCSLVTVNKMQVQGQTSSTGARLVGRDHSIYSIPATHAKLAGKSQHSFLVSAEKNASDQESCEDMYYKVLPKMLCRTLHWAVF
jgi:hypothetical protein